MTKWLSRLKWMRISKYAIVICLLLSIVFTGFTIYGAQTGNFTVYIQQSDVNIAIYMKEDKSDLGARLSVPTLEEMDDVTYADLTVPYVVEQWQPGLGSKNDEAHKQYLAFSFMLVNLSERLTDVDLALSVIENDYGQGGGDIINAMRVLCFTGDDYTQGTIYAQPETNEESRLALQQNTGYTTQDFISSLQIFSQTLYGLEEQAEVKITVLIWLEGWDSDCVNSIFGSRIKMRMDLFAR